MIYQLSLHDCFDGLLWDFEEYKGRRYAKPLHFLRLLKHMGIEGEHAQQICLQAAQIGAVFETLCRPGQSLMSDGAGQFVIGPKHARCWPHLIRPLHKMKAAIPEVAKEAELFRGRFKELYAFLKTVQGYPEKAARAKQWFRQIVSTPATFEAITKLLKGLQKV